MKNLIFIILLFSLIFGKDVPSDSLLQNSSVPITRKVFILPINLWQNLSFSTNSMNCQFEPSCSQYTALSIAKHGVIPGIIIGSDRIIRCNPMAYSYHANIDSGAFYIDGRLLDPVPTNLHFKKPDLRLAYNLIPGMSRVMQEKPVDGIFSFLLTATSGYASYKLFQDDKKIPATLLASVGVSFWLSDFYYYFTH